MMWRGVLSRPYERWSGDYGVDLVGMLCQAALCLSVPLRANREAAESPGASPHSDLQKFGIRLADRKRDAEVWD